jgi:NTE family protein
VSRVGLVLGGGGITGAAFEMAALMAVELATGWSPNQADVVVGTSSGAFVAALVRNDALSLDSLVGPEDGRDDVAERIRSHVFTKGPSGNVGTWLKHGVVPGIRRPGLTMFLGCPAPYHAGGVADWVIYQVGPDAADSWPDRATAIVAHDITEGDRVAFGTASAPDVALSDAVAASSAIPLLFRPYRIGESLYVDGGVSSGTHADLVLASPEPMDLVLVFAPLAADVSRKRARFHEKMFDRVGSKSLAEELAMIHEKWPEAEIVTLYPPPSVQNVARPNPMDPGRSVATFMRTLISMKRTLALPEVWDPLSRHLGRSALRRAVLR